MKRRVSYQTKMLNLLIQLPLAVFVVDFVWGWLKIDAGDTPGRASYGWLYVIFGFIPSVILYLVGYIGGLSRYVFIIKNIKNKPKSAQFWLVLGFVSFLLSGMCVFFGFSRVLFNYITLDSPFTQLVPILLLINLISIVFYNRCSKEEPGNDSKINQ